MTPSIKIFPLVLLFLASCATPGGGYILRRNVIETDRSVPLAERVTAEQIGRFIRQTPAGKLRFGAPPVILDTALTLRSVHNIEDYLRSRGYYASHLDWSIAARRNRARVTYSVTQGRPYRIGRIDMLLRDTLLRPEIVADTARTLLRTGDVFDLGTLKAERTRIANLLRDRGYYNFTVNNIEYLADSVRGGHNVDLTLVVLPGVAGYNERGAAQYTPNRRYHIGAIYLDPDHSSVAAPRDTTLYDGLHILHDGRLRVRERALRRMVNLRTGDLYNASAVERAYSEIVRPGYFRSASILFDDRGNDTLLCRINCVPAMRQSVRGDLEGSLSSNFFALGATLGYQNRNLLRGAELFDISLTWRHEFLRVATDSRTGSYEVGGVMSLGWSRLLSPVTWRTRGPQTRLEASFNYQNRHIYRRTLSGVRLSYTWNNGRNSEFVYRPVDLNLIDVRDIDQSFLDQLRNPYLRNSYRSQIVPGTSFAWLRKGRPTLRLNLETAGNLFSLIPRETHRMRFSQYARAEAALSNRIATGHRTSIVWRTLVGGGTAYGNSTPIPIDRLFYSGGSNSMRGWVVRRLGPGTLPNDDKSYPSQVANLKIEANVEFRFPVWDFVHSAIFLDAGNIWFTGHGDYEEENLNAAAMFRIDNFYRQLGINTGLGVRLDFRRFLFRVDWGLKLHDPGEQPSQRWIRNFRLRNTALNLAVGYPF